MIGSRALRYVLALSLAANLGVLGAVGYRAISAPSTPGTGPEFPGLVRYLQLGEEQQRHWRDAETAFLAQFEPRAREIHAGRDRLIRAIFAEEPDRATIDSERAEIARLQDEQQRAVIDQLLREQALLDSGQRQRLARLLLEQPVGASDFERLHRE